MSEGYNPGSDMDYNGPDVLLLRQVYDPSKGSPLEYVWTDDAACLWSDPELFQLSQFGDPDVEHIEVNQTARLTKFNREKVEKAKSICEGCPVRATCLKTASTSDLHWSVRGGQTPKRLDGQKAIPNFPMNEYMPWACKSCGGEKFTWYQNAGVRRRRCPICSNA